MFNSLLLVKTVGSALTIGAGALWGRSMALKLEKELDELKRFELALMNLATEVCYLLSPLPQALKASGEKAGGNTGTLFSLLGSLCGMEQRRTVEEALNMALELSDDMVLPACEIEILNYLAKNLGIWGHKEQGSFIDAALVELRNERGLFQEECNKKARMYRYLGVLAALGIVIVLL